MDRLIAGYRRFRAERWPEQRVLYEELAKEGQRPHTLVVGCSDSRVDPSTIFRMRPGELFVVRNVANIVPPYNQGAGLHGTGAAIEFACRVLRVQTILVMGHAQCGGIAAALEPGALDGSAFLSDWIALLSPAVSRVGSCADRHAAVERESIRISLERLRDYPFIAEALATGNLALEGAFFGVATGALEVLNQETGVFQIVE